MLIVYCYCDANNKLSGETQSDFEKGRRKGEQQATPLQGLKASLLGLQQAVPDVCSVGEGRRWTHVRALVSI